MAEGKCFVCGLMALVRHDGYLVCEECSTVQSEDMITSEYQDVVGYQAASENLWIMNDKQKLFTSYHHVPAGKLSGQTKIVSIMSNQSHEATHKTFSFCHCCKHCKRKMSDCQLYHETITLLNTEKQNKQQ
jgi:hypothetical protein